MTYFLTQKEFKIIEDFLYQGANKESLDHDDLLDQLRLILNDNKMLLKSYSLRDLLERNRSEELDFYYVNSKLQAVVNSYLNALRVLENIQYALEILEPVELELLDTTIFDNVKKGAKEKIINTFSLLLSQILTSLSQEYLINLEIYYEYNLIITAHEWQLKLSLVLNKII